MEKTNSINPIDNPSLTPREWTSVKLWDAIEVQMNAWIARYQAKVFEASEELAKLRAIVGRMSALRADLAGDAQGKKRQCRITAKHIIDAKDFYDMKTRAMQDHNDNMDEYRKRLHDIRPSELWGENVLQFAKKYGENAHRAERLAKMLAGVDLGVLCASDDETKGQALQEMKAEMAEIISQLESMQLNTNKG